MSSKTRAPRPSKMAARSRLGGLAVTKYYATVAILAYAVLPRLIHANQDDLDREALLKLGADRSQIDGYVRWAQSQKMSLKVWNPKSHGYVTLAYSKAKRTEDGKLAVKVALFKNSTIYRTSEFLVDGSHKLKIADPLPKEYTIQINSKLKPTSSLDSTKPKNDGDDCKDAERGGPNKQRPQPGTLPRSTAHNITTTTNLPQQRRRGGTGTLPRTSARNILNNARVATPATAFQKHNMMKRSVFNKKDLEVVEALKRFSKIKTAGTAAHERAKQLLCSLETLEGVKDAGTLKGSVLRQATKFLQEEEPKMFRELCTQLDEFISDTAKIRYNNSSTFNVDNSYIFNCRDVHNTAKAFKKSLVGSGNRVLLMQTIKRWLANARLSCGDQIPSYKIDK